MVQEADERKFGTKERDFCEITARRRLQGSPGAPLALYLGPISKLVRIGTRGALDLGAGVRKALVRERYP